MQSKVHLSNMFPNPSMSMCGVCEGRKETSMEKPSKVKAG